MTDVDTSDSDHTRLELSCPPGGSSGSLRARSPRPHTLPGLGGVAAGPAFPRKPVPPGTNIPGMKIKVSSNKVLFIFLNLSNFNFKAFEILYNSYVYLYVNVRGCSN